MASTRVLLALTGLVLVVGCSESPFSSDSASNGNAVVTPADPAGNPFLTPSPLPLQFPQFNLISDELYLPAFERGMEEQLAEIAAITAQSEAPTFENTLIPLERSGRTLSRVASVFFALSSANTNDAMQALEVKLSPLLSAHRDRILLNSALFARIKRLYDRRAALWLEPEQLRLIEITHRDFVRAGAQLSDVDKNRLRAINSELAELETKFNQNVLAQVNASAIVVDSRAELAGLSEAEIQAAADEATARNMPGKFLLSLQNTSGQPLLASLDNRSLRQRIMETSLARGSNGGEFDNLETLSRTARQRAERAQLLGYPNHAAYALEEQTAQSVEAVNQLLADLTPRAIANARRESADMQAMIQKEGLNFQLAAWDWAYYAEKVRRERYNFDESQLRPYFELNNVLEKGVFFAANRIYGITFKRRTDLPLYQEDVRIYEVDDLDGSMLGFFIFDPYARTNKSGGAWMNLYAAQSQLLDAKAIVGVHLNVTKPPQGEPALLTFDEVTTLFHEAGHGLHGLLSNVTYPSFSGTNVPRDFVEYPSQVNEMWSTWPEVLRNYAVHHGTGAPMPTELLDKVLEAQKFNQGFVTSEYLMASITDMALHQLSPEQVPTANQLMKFEADTLTAAGANLDMLPPRYRLPYFLHIMVGGYSAGYYSYIWSEVLDADTVVWFKANGGMTRTNGQHFRDTLLSRGGSVEALDLFRNFAGREPNVEPLLIRRGLN
ncbi:MAG: M3 family metallopeptidase [Gammaproteobacteria bacterium]|nr:M3 family metallopeptidase [Gammaproteobacteria bacterium]